MKCIVVMGIHIVAIYDEANGNVPKEAISISNEAYEMIKNSKNGFSEFIFVSEEVKRVEEIDKYRQLNYEIHDKPNNSEKPFGVDDLILEVLTLLEMSKITCRFNLSYKGQGYLGIADSPPDTFLNAIHRLNLVGLGGDLV